MVKTRPRTLAWASIWVTRAKPVSHNRRFPRCSGRLSEGLHFLQGQNGVVFHVGADAVLSDTCGSLLTNLIRRRTLRPGCEQS